MLYYTLPTNQANAVLDKQDNTAQTSNNDTRPSLWQKLKMENQERKAKEVQYVSSDQAENITGYGDERVKRGEEERKRKGEKSGNASFAAMMLS